MRVEDILPKEDSFEKLQAVQGKPQKNFIFAPEFNAVVESLKAVKEEVEKPKVEAILTPEFYGAKGDGIEDDTNALNLCFDKARFENKIVFLTGKYRVTSILNVHNLSIVSQNAEIIADTNDFVMQARGSRSVFRRILNGTTVTRGTTFVDLNTAADVIALGLKPGDLIKIRSRGILFDSDISFSSPGEIQRVHSISGNRIFINGSFEDTYQGIESHQTEVCKINAVRFENTGLLTVTQGLQSNSQGFVLDFCDNPRVDMKFVNCFKTGIMFIDSYAPVCRVESMNNNNLDTGYGLNIINSVMYGRFTGVVNGARHAVATGSNGGERGVSWGCVVHDFVGVSGTQFAVYDTHASTGSIIFERCVAKGLPNRFGTTLTPRGFQLNSILYTIRDCEVYNCTNAVQLSKSGRKHEKVIIDGLYCEDIINHAVVLAGQCADFEDLTIKNVIVKNKTFLQPLASSSQAFLFAPDRVLTIDNLDIKDIEVVNIQCLINIGVNILLPNGLNLKDLKHEYTIQPPNALTDHNVCVRIQNLNDIELTLTDCECINVSLLRVHFSSIMNNISINNCKVTNSRASFVWLQHASATNVSLIGCQFRGDTPVVEPFFLRTLAVTNLMIVGCTVAGTRLFGVFTSASTIQNFHESVNMLIGARQIINGGIFEPGQTAVNWILSGSSSNPYLLRGTAAPEGVVTARPGAIYLRTTGEMYLKTSGTSNTGWTLK